MVEKIVGLLFIHLVAPFIGTTKYAGVLLLMGIESACIPLPSEIIMPFAGYLAYTGRLSLVGAAVAGALGCNLGSAVAYWIGAKGGRPMVERFGRYVLLSRRDLDLADRFFHRYGGVTVFISRLLPVVRTFIALPAGIARMPQLRFHLYTFFGSLPWCYALAYIGAKLGAAWQTDPRLKHVLHRFDAAILALLVVGFLWFVRTHWAHRVRVEAAVSS